MTQMARCHMPKLPKDRCGAYYKPAPSSSPVATPVVSTASSDPMDVVGQEEQVGGPLGDIAESNPEDQGPKAHENEERLLAENQRLKKLVVRLSELIIRNVVRRK